MESKLESLHVNPVGENWEVESEAITLGKTETQSEAIELIERTGIRSRGRKHRRKLLASRSKVMGKFTLPFYLKILGWLATSIMAVTAVGMLLTSGK
jgi:hypothetical protein